MRMTLINMKTAAVWSNCIWKRQVNHLSFTGIIYLLFIMNNKDIHSWALIDTLNWYPQSTLDQYLINTRSTHCLIDTRLTLNWHLGWTLAKSQFTEVSRNSVVYWPTFDSGSLLYTWSQWTIKKLYLVFSFNFFINYIKNPHTC